MFHSPFLKVVCIGFLLAALVFLAGPRSWFPDFYAPHFMGAGAVFFTVLVWLPGWLVRHADTNQRWSVRQLQHALAIGLILSGLGELGLWQLYRVGFEYDKLIHAIFPFLVTAALAPVVHYRYGRSVRSSIFLSMLVVLLAGVLWEYAEFYNDRLFGTHFFGVYGADVYRDTIIDLVCNFLGGTVAAVTMWLTHPCWTGK